MLVCDIKMLEEIGSPSGDVSKAWMEGDAGSGCPALVRSGVLGRQERSCDRECIHRAPWRMEHGSVCRWFCLEKSTSAGGNEELLVLGAVKLVDGLCMFVVHCWVVAIAVSDRGYPLA